MPKHSSIIFISSIFATQPSLDLGYDMTKAAINHLAINHALELSLKGIRANAIAPGHIDTQTTDQPRVESDVPVNQKTGLPTDIAQTCLFLTNLETVNYITDITLPITGGLHIPTLTGLK